MARWVSKGHASARAVLFGVGCALTRAMVPSRPGLLLTAVSGFMALHNQHILS